MQKTALARLRVITGGAVCIRRVHAGHRDMNKTKSAMPVTGTAAGEHHRGTGKKMLCVMKLTFIFLTVAFLNVSARGLSQSVSLKVKNAPLTQVFREIEK